MGAGSLELLDWRRQVTALYSRVRVVAATDPADAHALWREGRDALYAGHPQSPLASDDERRATGLRVAAYDPGLRFTAALVPEPPASQHPGELTVRTGTDGAVSFTRLGSVSLPVGSLDVWWLTGYAGGLWLPVRDTGPCSYGGGRYLLDTVKGADLGPAHAGSGDGGGTGALVVDLNFLYNPSCAYDEAWACPLAPPGNRLTAALEVGELA